MSTYRELRGLKVKYLAADPSPATAGDVWYDSVTYQLKGFVGRKAWSAGSNLGTALAGSTPVLKLSANTTNGFSVGAYTGTSNNATIAHGLSQGPEIVIVKCYDGATYNWTAGWTPGAAWTDYMHVDTTAAAVDDAAFWQDTAPTASVINIGANGNVSATGDDFVFYAWHSVEGYSKVGSYSGNGSTDGPFIYTGMKPSYLLIKTTNLTNHQWYVWDDKREPYNTNDKVLYPSDPMAEQGPHADYAIDFASNGFKIRNASNFDNNSSGTYLYWAFAESPFKTSNAR